MSSATLMSMTTSTSSRARPAGRLSATMAHTLLLELAAGLWVVSLFRINPNALDDYGLISVLPATYFGAALVLCVGFAWAVASASVSRWVPQAYVLALVAVLHANAPLLYDAPKYAYVYKHLAVIEYIRQYGAVARSVDIYHNWPGFFGANALLSDLTGVSAQAYANWAQPFFMAGIVLALRYLLGGLTTDHRRVAVALWLFVIGSWLAPTYLAPQSMAFLLTLVILGVVLRHLRPEAAPAPDAQARRFRSARLLVTRVLGPQDPAAAARIDRSGFSPRIAAVLVLALSAAIVVSHQLTPFFLVVSLTLLVLARRCRYWWLPLAVVVMTVLQVTASWDYLSQHQTLFSFDLFSNVQGAQSTSPTAGTAGHQFAALTARVLSVALVGLAVLGWVRVGRTRGETWLLLQAFAPGLLVLVQAYGGEGIYRIFVFMCPWLAYLASGLVTTRTAPVSRQVLRRGAVLASASMVGILLLIVSAFGLERVTRIEPQEVAAATWAETTTPAGSILAVLASNYPVPLTARYSLYFNGDGNWGGEVISNAQFLGRRLTAADVPVVAQYLRNLAAPGQRVYLSLGPSEAAFAESYGYAPVGSVEPFSDLLVASPEFRVVFRDHDAYVLEVLPAAATDSVTADANR